MGLHFCPNKKAFNPYSLIKGIPELKTKNMMRKSAKIELSAASRKTAFINFSRVSGRLKNAALLDKVPVPEFANKDLLDLFHGDGFGCIFFVDNHCDTVNGDNFVFHCGFFVVLEVTGGHA